MYHQWQKAADLNTEPNSAVAHWNGVSEGFGGGSEVNSPAGDIAVVKNLDNTLQVFVPTSDDVFYILGSRPRWRLMGSLDGYGKHQRRN